MLLGLSGGGCFRAFAGLEATLRLASSGAVAISSTMVRVDEPANAGVETSELFEIVFIKRELPRQFTQPYGATRFHASAKPLAEQDQSCTCHYEFFLDFT